MNILQSQTSLVHQLVCSNCHSPYALESLQTFATCCEKPLVASYKLDDTFKKTQLKERPANMWRYAEVLPVLNPENIVSLGEGMTPVFDLTRLAHQHGFDKLMVKDEGLNPTGSFKARGLSMAVSKAKELGVNHAVIPTAGNAGGAMSAYCAAAGIKATVVMPGHTPKIFQQECVYYGAEVILIDGLINNCAAKASEIERKTGAFNMATLKEPYRLEGKKTMGYEIAEQLNWELPDVILYPTGGGTGLIGIWKAFYEMIGLGWLPSDIKLPKMIVVQAENCAPMVDFIKGVERDSSAYRESIANGLAVPVAFGKDMIRNVVRESGGMALTVTEQEMIEGMQEVSSNEGILMAPEGAALWKALLKLKNEGHLSGAEKIMMINTGNGYKYLENVQE
ncbi:MAG: threonine synthase [Roseivirga sp.]|nr:threonine synthase [Roseivirga sp.]